MTRPRPLPPVEFLQECFRYDPATGALYWRERPDSHFSSPEVAAKCNSRLAGTPALCTQANDALRGEFIYRGQRYRVSAHRVIFKLMTGQEPPLVDHKNCDPTDNRWVNLRAADVKTNRYNNRGRDNGLPKCVVFDRGRFRAIGGVGSAKVRLGTYKTPAEAHAAWRAWAEPRHGEFFNPGLAVVSVFD